MDGIEQRGTDTWRITVATGRDPASGRYGRIRETVHGSKMAARRRRDELRVQVSRGTVAQANRETVAGYLERSIVHREHVGKVRPDTAKSYRGHVRREVTPRIGSMRMTDVRPVHIQRVLDEALEGGRSARTVVQVHRILHAAFRTAVRWQLVSANPSDGVTPPKVERPKLTVPSAHDVARLLEATDPQFRSAVALAAASGLRRGEVLALRWADLDLDAARPSLRVEGSLQRTRAGLAVLAPKTERSRRMIPITAGTAATLKRHRTEQNERRLIAGPAWHDSDFVFDAGDGRPVDPDALSKAFHRAASATGLGGVRLHDLRHAVATMLVESGTDARVVADLLGHSAISFTLATYYHPSEDAAVTALETVERLIGGESGANRSRR
jgi:integrase